MGGRLRGLVQTKNTTTAGSASSPPGHRGEDQVILPQRKAVYEAAKAKHPERWSGDIRNWDRVESVSLNLSKSPWRTLGNRLKTA